MNLPTFVQNKRFDLHIHTNHSDGIYSPQSIVEKANKANIEVIAITDHDTISGCEEAKLSGIKHGITVIPGVELSTTYQNKPIDILGYNFSFTKPLESILKKAREERESRAFRIIEKLNEQNIPLTINDVRNFSGDGLIARPHIAKAVVKKGYAKNTQTVFDRYLADGKPCSIEKMILSPKEAIDLIHECGGIASLAHPGLVKDEKCIEDLLNDHCFDGIEVWHRKHTKKQSQHYLHLSQKHDLFCTGGSDFHDNNHKLGSFGY